MPTRRPKSPRLEDWEMSSLPLGTPVRMVSYRLEESMVESLAVVARVRRRRPVDIVRAALRRVIESEHLPAVKTGGEVSG